MHINVDLDRCQGHGNCAMLAPALFRLDEHDGRAAPIAGELAPDQEALAREAAANCPERAIVVAEVDRANKR